MMRSGRDGIRRGASGVARWAAAVLACVVVLPVAPALGAPHDLELVSRADGLSGANGNNSSFAPSVSADGRYVAFHSAASNLDPGDTDIVNDVFVRDLVAGTTTLVSRATGATGAKGDSFSYGPSVSADGRYVAFYSHASNLDPGDTDSISDVFVRDLVAGTTTLVSRATGPSGAKGNSGSASPSVSADGRYVAFSSAASTLDSDDTDNVFDVFVRDLVDETTTLVSRADGPSGAKGDGLSASPSVSADGRYVAFRSAASNLNLDDTDSISDVFVRDLVAGTTTLVSRADGLSGAKGDGGSLESSVSADGRYVAFRSNASNLDPDDTDIINDVFVRDLVAGTTTLVSRATGPSGAKGNAGSLEPSVSADGRYVAFDSNASNLHLDDTNSNVDVFRRELGVAAASYEDAVLADAPVGYWRLGEASGTVAADSSGNGHHGAYFNGAVLGQLGAILGDSDTAALFDGVNDEMRVPHAPGLNVGSTFTAEAWIKRSAVTQSHSIVSKGANGLQLVVMNAANGNQVWLRKTGVTTIATSSVGVPADGEYHHVAATMDGAGTARIYVDGVDVTVAAPNQHLQVIGNTTLPLRFAGAAGSVAAAYDELALYASALSATRVQEHHAAGVGP